MGSRGIWVLRNIQWWTIYQIAFGCVVGVAVLALLLWLNTPVSHTFPDPVTLKQIPKPDFVLVPSYSSIVGESTLGANPDYPCSTKQFRTEDQIETVLSSYRENLERDGWYEALGTPVANELEYFKGGYALIVAVRRDNSALTHVSLRLCLMTR
jgi:hypothetical protein